MKRPVVWLRSRYGPLVAILFVLAGFGPALVDVTRGEAFIAVIFTLLMLACAMAVSERRATRWSVLVFALVVIGADASLSLAPVPPFIVGVGSLRAAFLAFVTAAILRDIVRTERVTYDTILGGICIYLLIGLFFQSVFGMVETVSPGSFRKGDAAVGSLAGTDPVHGRYPVLIYYSFITLSTVGFGDVTPTWSLPQALSATEAVIGQLYLAILVASLVGMRLAGQGAGRGGR